MQTTIRVGNSAGDARRCAAVGGRPRWRALLGGTAVVAMALAGCTPGSSHAQPHTPGPSQTDPARLGKVTLTVWDTRTASGENQAQQRVNAQFEAKYPNIKVHRVAKAFNDYEATLKLALSSPNPPDVAQINQGYGDLATFAKAGLLLPMDGYAKAYGWVQHYNATLLAQNRAESHGLWGVGQLYGPSNQAELIGLFYNKKLLAKLGLQPPSTLDELEADLPKIKAAGMLPINLGTSDKYGAIHIYGLLQAVLAGATEVNNLVFGKGDAKWTDTSSLAAATLLQSWTKNGYISPGANGQSAADMNAQFGKGQGVFMIDGDWAAPQEQAALGNNVGFTVLSDKAGGTPATEGGLSLLWGISAGSKHSDAAAAYINFLLSPAGEDTVAQSGDLPALKTATYRPTPGSMQAQIYACLHQVLADGTLLPYLDYTTANFYTVLATQLQELIGRQSSPSQVMSALQSEYATAKAARS
jgi:raffinose/stachyose/melibiose transport system substrate-binding protein